MSLDYILLGILRKPGTGYDIKAAFDEVFNHFWQAQQSQIYRTLKRLEDEGSLASRTEPSDRGPDRRVYAITPRGRERLREWLSGEPVVGEDRHTFLAQVFFLDELGDMEASLAFMKRLRERLAERRDTLEGIDAYWREHDPDYPDRLDDADFHAALTLDLGLMKTRAQVEWAEKSIRRLEERLEKKNGRMAS